MRRVVRDHEPVATCLGFDPRFLHSTRQVYKGGPNKGVCYNSRATMQQTCRSTIKNIPLVW